MRSRGTWQEGTANQRAVHEVQVFFECWMLARDGHFSSMAFHFRQNSMFHFALYFAQSILHFVFGIWVCTRDSTFLHSTFNFDLCNIQVFAFDIQLFKSNSQVLEFYLQVQWNVHSFSLIQHLAFVLQVFASDIRLWALYLQVSAFDIQLFDFDFYPLVSDRLRSWAQLTWPTPAQMVVERLPSRVGSGDLLHSRQTKRRQHGRPPGCGTISC